VYIRWSSSSIQLSPSGKAGKALKQAAAEANGSVSCTKGHLAHAQRYLCQPRGLGEQSWRKKKRGSTFELSKLLTYKLVNSEKPVKTYPLKEKGPFATYFKSNYERWASPDILKALRKQR
jgi:hypothetical protein